MDKKIAVILYGQYRVFDIAVKSWYFRFHLDCDFYVSTWRKTVFNPINSKNEPYEVTVTEDMFLKHLPNAKVSIHDEEHFIFDKTKMKCSDLIPSKMIFHMKHGLKMINDNNIKYDYLLITRPDIFLFFLNIK